jgi:hypothetical protein
MISAVVSFVLRVVLTVAGLLFVLALMGVALVTLTGVVVWSLIRGRRPKIDVSGFAKARNGFGGGGFNAGRVRKPMGEVVDVEAREVPATTPRIE